MTIIINKKATKRLPFLIFIRKYDLTINFSYKEMKGEEIIMLKISFMIPEEQVNYIQRFAFEAEGRKKIVMEMIDANKDNPAIIESATFEKYHKLYIEAMASFEIARTQIEKIFVPKELRTSELGSYTQWNLDYLTNEMIINFKSDIYDDKAKQDGGQWLSFAETVESIKIDLVVEPDDGSK